MYTPWPLDSKWAQVINPTTNAAWFKLLRETLESGDDGKPIAQECCWGVDESGFQSGLEAMGKKAIGGAGKKSQYQQGDATQENITVLGKAYQPKWNQDNPTNAFLGYSKKGWTDGEIGVLWIKQFNEQTCTKADAHATHVYQGLDIAML
ncbi:hypothetical protein PILCRDRAFT_89016 [Piloderma croceum F 1598]|uniref:DDE-1 domain-containing protein n=1 Tax=Piloderma croceum (strain F 1598) TaxID=765440 RepID=A0A0C3FNZ4_PILCF|nr:hypothetical protein PILCRDRAFT_89016 [Piloderma croceum F 1598]